MVQTIEANNSNSAPSSAPSTAPPTTTNHHANSGVASRQQSLLSLEAERLKDLINALDLRVKVRLA